MSKKGEYTGEFKPIMNDSSFKPCFDVVPLVDVSGDDKDEESAGD